MDEIFKDRKTDSKEDYYYILGCDPNSSNEQIVCEYRTRAVRLHPDKHDNIEEAEESFKRLVKAKEVLTDPQMKKSYDMWRASGLTVSFEKWQRMGREVHLSMHWRNTRSKDLMLESGQEEVPTEEGQVFGGPSERMHSIWNRDDNEMLSKFRKYEI